MFITGIMTECDLARESVAIFKHHIRIRHELATLCHSNKGQVGNKGIATGDLLQDGIRDRNMPQHAFRVGIDSELDAYSRIIRNAFRCEVQRKTDKVPIQSFQPVALPSIKNNKLLHKVSPESQSDLSCGSERCCARSQSRVKQGVDSRDMPAYDVYERCGIIASPSALIAAANARSRPHHHRR